MDRIDFNRFVEWLDANKKTVAPDTWELRISEFKMGYRAGR